MEIFFLIVPPGLEHLAIQELKYWWSQLDEEIPFSSVPLRVYKGGLEIECVAKAGFQLNQVLKLPVRILLRFDQFRCRDLPTLFKRVSRLPWRRFVGKGELRWHVSTHASRLKMHNRIQETCEKAYDAFARGHEPRASATSTDIDVYVRIIDDQCTISIDTSGEPLFKRGYRQLIGHAPLRENFAAALIWQIFETADVDLSRVALIDAMTGAGTLLLEAAQIFKANTYREFAFQHFPTWSNEELPHQNHSALGKYYGFDLDPKALEIAKQNLSMAGVEVQLGLRDARSLDSEPILRAIASAREIWLVLNPPYGERMEVADPLFYNQVFSALERSFTPARVGCILPKSSLGRLSLPEQWKPLSAIHVNNGGIEVEFLVCGRQGH